MSAACRLCRGTTLAPRMALEHVPRNISYLPTPEEAASDPPIRLEVFACTSCGHVQLAVDPASDYYEDYLMTVSHSPPMRTYQDEQARALVDRYGLAGRRLVEVGCGDGNYLALLRAHGAEAVGIEP